METLWPVLPQSLQLLLRKLPESVLRDLEEIRIRENRPLEVGYCANYAFIDGSGALTLIAEHAYLPTHADCSILLDLVTNHSMYSVEEELKRGFLTIRGGHRIGLAGRTVLDHGQVKFIRDVGSFNIRIARQLPGVGKQVIGGLLDPSVQSVHHTLILSPPQLGKTTLLRDLCRLISHGFWPEECKTWSGLKVGIVDERSELAACVKGIPHFDVGPRTDVLDGCPKAEGMMMLIRSMSPQVLAVDEIGRMEDAFAVKEALHAGIRVIATAHGHDLQDAERRPVLRQLLSESIFNRIVVIRRSADPRSISIYNRDGQKVSYIRERRVGM